MLSRSVGIVLLLALEAAWPSLTGAEGLPPFDAALRDSLWQEAVREVDTLPFGAYAGKEAFVCGAGTWGDSGQVDEWDKGRSPCWPSSMTITSSWDTELVARWSLELAEEFGLANRGQLGPGVNLARFAWNGRLGEYMSGEDPYFGARMVAAMVTAYRQVDHPPLQVVKHFIPNTVETDRNGMTEVVDERTLFEVYYPPFAAAVDAGVSAVMCSYNLVQCTTGKCSADPAYACANDDVLNKHLKKEMGFHGIVMSDWDATRCQAEAAGSGGCSGDSDYINNDYAARAGLDLEMPSCMTFKDGVSSRAKEKAVRMHWAYKVQGRSLSAGRRLSGAASRWLRAGLLGKVFCCWWGQDCAACPEGARDASAGQSLCEQSKATWCPSDDGGKLPTRGAQPLPAPAPGPDWSIGVYQDNPFGSAQTDAPPSTLPPMETHVPGWTQPDRCPEMGANNYKSPCKLELADRIIVESTVVLKNEGGLLPLAKHASVALVGAQACASDPLAQGGGSGWNGPSCNDVPKVNVRDGLRALGASSVTCGGARDAAVADVIIVVVAAAKAFEGSDRETLQLSVEDTELIRSYAPLKNRVVVAMNAPGPMIVSPWEESAAAILVSWLPGQQNGRGIATALYGDGYEASGRLPFTFPRCATAACSTSDERASVHLGTLIGSSALRNFSEKALIGYRWYHAQGQAVSYPFGFGVFAYGSAEVAYSLASAQVDGSGVSVSATLSHDGPRAGRDVPQLYLSFPTSVPGEAASRPEWVLKGFQKVLVQPGAPVIVAFNLTQRDLSYWDDAVGKSRWFCARGVFKACVGANSRDAVAGRGACTTFVPRCGGGDDLLMTIIRRNEAGLPALRAAAASASGGRRWLRLPPVTSVTVAALSMAGAAVAVALRRWQGRSTSYARVPSTGDGLVGRLAGRQDAEPALH